MIRNLAVLETNVTDQASPGLGSGGVRIRADHIEMVGINEFDLETFTFPFTGIRSDVAPMSAGEKSGDITLDANSIHMKDASQLTAATFSASDSGNITVRAVRNIESENNGNISTGTQGSDEGILISGQCRAYRTHEHPRKDLAGKSYHYFSKQSEYRQVGEHHLKRAKWRYRVEPKRTQSSTRLTI